MIKATRLVPVVCLAVLYLSAAYAAEDPFGSLTEPAKPAEKKGEGSGAALELFSKTVGEIQVKPVEQGDAMTVPFITWGGDVATFHANGGLQTKPGTIFDKLGLKVKLVNGDDFPKQVKDYLEGKTPLLRGTFGMLSQASQVVNADPASKGVVCLQLTWSAGDHMVARENLKTLNDLKSEKVALQKGGPHVGMLNDTLRTAGLTWKDIKVEWTEELTGDKGSAAAFRKDAGVDACMVISPDMSASTGGLDQTWDGAEESVRGAHVLNSRAELDKVTAYSFTISFDPNRSDFPIAEYATSFQRAIDTAALWGHAALVVRGHADPGNTLQAFVQAGLKTGDLKREGIQGNYQFTWKGKSLDLGDTAKVVGIIHEAAKDDPKYTQADFFIEECLRLSETRVKNVQRGCVEYAKSVNLGLNESQIIIKAVGIVEPAVPLPRSEEDIKRNCRVEFRLIKIPLESLPKEVIY